MDKDKIKRLYYYIGNKIAELRKKNNITQSNLADKINISRASVVNIEKGRQHAPLHLLWTIAENLNVSIETLLPTEDDLTVKHLTIESLDSHPDVRSNEVKEILTSFMNEIDTKNQDSSN